MAELLTLSRRVTPTTLRRKLILAARTPDLILLVMTQNSWPSPAREVMCHVPKASFFHMGPWCQVAPRSVSLFVHCIAPQRWFSQVAGPHSVDCLSCVWQRQVSYSVTRHSGPDSRGVSHWPLSGQNTWVFGVSFAWVDIWCLRLRTVLLWETLPGACTPDGRALKVVTAQADKAAFQEGVVLSLCFLNASTTSWCPDSSIKLTTILSNAATIPKNITQVKGKFPVVA